MCFGVHARIALDRVLERQQQLHAGQAVRIAARDGVGDGIDDEARADTRQALLGRFGMQSRRLGLRERLRPPRPRTAAASWHIQAFALGLREARQDREHRRQIQHVRIQVHIAERGRAANQLLVDARLVLIGQRVRDLDDDHAVEQRLVLLLLQELVELREVGVREDGLVQMDQREARHLDVLLLRHGQQQIQELALHLQDLDHLEHAAARGIHGAGPRPGARIAFIADLRDFRQIDRADQVRDVRRRGIVRRIGADADARGFREEDALDGNAHEVAFELALDVNRAPTGDSSPWISTP